MAPVTVAVITAFTVGLLIHSYIAFTIIIQWLHGKPVTPIDQVLTSLGISRMFLQFFSFLDVLLSVYQHGYLASGTTKHSVIGSLFGFFNYSSIWFSTLFAVTFCLKIVNRSHGLFLRIKAIVYRRMVSLIVLSLVVSIVYTSLYLFLVATSVEAPNNGAKNWTHFSHVSPIRLQYVLLFLLGNTAPIGIYCVSFALIISFLILHIKKMKANDNSTPFHLDGYYMAINSMAFCCLCYLLTILSNMLVLCHFFMLQVIWMHVILNVFPIAHSIFLIYRTSYLRQYFTALYNSTVHCMLPGRKASSEDIVVTVT